MNHCGYLSSDPSRVWEDSILRIDLIFSVAIKKIHDQIFANIESFLHAAWIMLHTNSIITRVSIIMIYQESFID